MSGSKNVGGWTMINIIWLFLKSNWKAVLIGLAFITIVTGLAIYRSNLIKYGYKACEADYVIMQKEVFEKAQNDIEENEKEHENGKKKIISMQSVDGVGSAVNSAFEWLRTQPYYSE